MKILEIESNNGRDIYAKTECTCPSKKWASSSIAHIMKTKINFTGYNDNFFFDVVNKEPREQACECGKKYTFQWKRDGVEFEWVDK